MKIEAHIESETKTKFAATRAPGESLSLAPRLQSCGVAAPLIMKRPNMDLLTRKGYRSLVNKAKEFANALTMDSGYTNPSINRVALESMLIGWLRGTPRWRLFEKHCDRYFPRTDIYVIAQDQALQAAQDAIFSETEDGLITYFCTVKELNQMIEDTPPLRKRCFLAAKIDKAMKRVGLVDLRETKGRKTRMAQLDSLTPQPQQLSFPF